MNKIYTEDRIAKNREIHRIKDVYGKFHFICKESYTNEKLPCVREYKKHNGKFYFLGDLIHKSNIEAYFCTPWTK